jgi:hypothetical protein
MSKILIVIFFAIAVVSVNPFNVHAQENSAGMKQQTQTEIIKQNKSGTLQDLKSKLVDQYGVNGFRFVKDGELKELKNQKTLSAKELSEVSALDEYTIIIILAAIGAIAVILFIFK